MSVRRVSNYAWWSQSAGGAVSPLIGTAVRFVRQVLNRVVIGRGHY
jgi:hypothetical protein